MKMAANSFRAPSLIILDLDNTLYDWVDAFVPAFRSYLAVLSEISKVPQGRLKSEFRRVHQQHGTSEYDAAIEEIGAVPRGHEYERAYKEAFAAFDAERRSRLTPYAGVEDTLAALAQMGCQLVAHTDSGVSHAMRRLAQLGLDRHIDLLVAPEDHEYLPLDCSDGHALPELRQDIVQCRVHVLSATERKPNPRVVADILLDTGFSAADAYYVGDSLTRDILMAQRAGVCDVLASYGVAHHKDDYGLLVEISHWTAEEVANEKALSTRHISPTHEIATFPALLDVFIMPELVAAP